MFFENIDSDAPIITRLPNDADLVCDKYTPLKNSYTHKMCLRIITEHCWNMKIYIFDPNKYVRKSQAIEMLIEASLKLKLKDITKHQRLGESFLKSQIN